jgi:hypothetical protein
MRRIAARGDLVGGEQAPGQAKLAGLGDLERHLLGEHRSPHVAGRSLAEDFACILRQEFANERIQHHRLELSLRLVHFVGAALNLCETRARVSAAGERRRRRTPRLRHPVQVSGKVSRRRTWPRKRVEPLGSEGRARRIGRAGHLKDDICTRIEGHWAPRKVRREALASSFSLTSSLRFGPALVQ